MSLGMIFSLLALVFSFISFDFAGLYANSASGCFDLSNSINEFFSTIPYGFISNEYVLIISIIALIIIIYLALSKSNKQFVFRLVYSIICVVIISTFESRSEEVSIKIYPREQFVVAEIKLTPNETFFYLCERKPEQYARNDYQLENYICEKDEVILGINGNATINFADNIIKKKDVRVVSIPLEIQEKIEKILFSQVMLYKYNKIKVL
jgi:hypothetical protein